MSALFIIIVVGGPAVIGLVMGRRARQSRDGLREPTSIIQGALLGFVGLLLAFGLSMAVDRYESRRAAVVNEANAIGTTYLRAQTLDEPQRSASLLLLAQYTDARIAMSHVRPGSGPFNAAVKESRSIQNPLWANAAAALDRAPTEVAPQLYEEALNVMIDMDTTRVAALNNRIPFAVIALQVIGSAVVAGALAFYLGLHDRGSAAALLGSVFIILILMVIVDLDRPARGVVTVPSTALTALRASMEQPPAAGGPIQK
jgi:hypothetical protein